MAQLLVDVTPFKSVLRESKEKPGTFEVECKELKQQTKMVEFTLKIY